MLMQQFEITLKNEKIKFYKILALLLVLLNMAVFIFLLISGVDNYKVALALLVSGLYLIYLLVVAKKNKTVFHINGLSFFILAGCWVALQDYLIAFACITLGLLYHLSLQKFHFVFNEGFVKKMNFPQQTYSWDMFDNVILKDNILTMDLKSNKLIQIEIDNSVNEIQFNEFAQQKLIQKQVQ